ncbi:MAG TPA: lysylphosphatidylglycerol synthase domain-containing protein [Chloroflexia bacterium]|nr:lysylphosphatidylglycerol synthase domain-containing protein [Chloroflexia bacterium]
MQVASNIGNWVRSPRARQTIRIVLTLVVIGGFLVALATQTGALREYDWRVEPAYLIIAALVALGRGVPVVYPWWRIVTAWGYKLPWWRAVRVYFHSGLARYLPGQWWFVVGRAYLAEREGIRRAATAASIAIETVLLTGSAVVIAGFGLATLWSDTPIALPATFYLALLAVAIVALLLASPGLLEVATERLLRWKGYEPMPARLRLGDTTLALLGCCANWLMYGLIAALLLAGLAGEDYMTQTPAVIGIFATGVLSGSALLFVPQGIVVREGVLVYLLHTLLGVPVPVGIAVAALTRLVAMLAEGVWALVALKL